MKQKHVVVVDGLWVGHHQIYIKTFVKILLGAGYQVSLFCPAPDEVSSWVSQTLSLESSRFKAHYFSDREPWLWKYLPRKIRSALWSWPRWLHVSRSLRKFFSSSEQPDMVFFAWVDCYLIGYLPTRIIDWLFPFKWSGLYFHPRHLRARKDEGAPGRKQFFDSPEHFISASKWAASIAVLDEGIFSALRLRLRGKQAAVFPDFSDEIPPSDHYPPAEEIRAKAKGRKIMGLLGSLERRKGMLTLLRVAQQPMARDWYFVFSGVLAEQTFSEQELNEIKSFFDVPRDNCFACFDRIREDAQFNALVNVCDVIFAVYQDFPHSSNLVTKAAAYGKSLLVSSGGYMEEVVRQYGLGEVVPEDDVKAAIAAMSRLIATGSSQERAAGMRAYSVEQSQDRLRQALLDLVENGTGHAAENGMTGMH